MTFPSTPRARILLTLGLSALAATIFTTTFISYEEAQTARTQLAARTRTTDPAKMAPADRMLAQKIRKVLRTDKSLSATALNIQITSQDGKVALLGPVRSEQEKIAIDSKAIAIAGVDNVANELTIASVN